jgi:hypothetical protein
MKGLFSEVEQPTPESHEALCEYFAAECVVAHQVGLQIRDIHWQRGPRFQATSTDAFAELRVSLARWAWEVIKLNDSMEGDEPLRLAISLDSWDEGTQELLDKHRAEDDLYASDFVEDVWNEDIKLLDAPQARATVKALASKIDDELHGITGLDATAFIELTLQQP